MTPLDGGMGVCMGLLSAVPAIVLYSSMDSRRHTSGAKDLAEFLECGIPAWRKLSAVFP